MTLWWSGSRSCRMICHITLGCLVIFHPWYNQPDQLYSLNFGLSPLPFFSTGSVLLSFCHDLLPLWPFPDLESVHVVHGFCSLGWHFWKNMDSHACRWRRQLNCNSPLWTRVDLRGYSGTGGGILSLMGAVCNSMDNNYLPDDCRSLAIKTFPPELC